MPSRAPSLDECGLLNSAATMAVPTYDAMMAPLLALAAKGPITRKASTPVISDHFKLSQEDRDARTLG